MYVITQRNGFYLLTYVQRDGTSELLLFEDILDESFTSIVEVLGSILGRDKQ
jgi:hypothetical protein